MPNYLDQLAEFASHVSYESLTDSARTAAADVLMDTIGAIIGGSRISENANLARLAAGNSNTGSATLLGHNLKAQPPMAALANATSGVSLEMDEGTRLGGGHPAIHVLPGALAVAEDLGCSGPRLAEALIAGYEVSSRIGGATKALPNVHSHGTWGTIGTAVAAARLMDFNPHQMRGVINLSASMSPANTWTPCFQGATIRNVYPGRSGMQGVLAPHLLLCGFTPPSDAPTDVYTTILGDEFHPEATVAGLGSGPLRIEQNYFKFHACCLYNHPVLDAVEAIADRVSIISDPSMDLQNPDKPCARVDVALSDGRTFSESTTFHRGDFQRRRSRVELENKFRFLTSPTLSPDQTESVIRTTANFANLENVQTLTALLQPPPSPVLATAETHPSS